jgi:uncharacterized membrane protein (UPF0127 family)
MQKIIVTNLSHPLKTPIRVEYCVSYFDKLIGLMGQPEIKKNEGLVLDQKKEDRLGSSIHMFFMRFDICAIWINSQFIVVDLIIAKRWKPYYIPHAPARYVLEVHPFQKDNFYIGDKLNFEDL